MGSAVVVVPYPLLESLLAFLERVELGPHEELLPQARPEPLDFAQRHRVLRSRDQVGDAILGQLAGEATFAPPARVLATAVGEHFFRRLVFADGAPVGFDHGLRRRAAVEAEAGDVTRVVVQERDDVGVLAA